MVFLCEEHVPTWVMMWYHSDTTICMGPHPCVYGIPLRVYYGYRGYCDGCLNGTNTMSEGSFPVHGTIRNDLDYRQMVLAY